MQWHERMYRQCNSRRQSSEHGRRWSSAIGVGIFPSHTTFPVALRKGPPSLTYLLHHLPVLPPILPPLRNDLPPTFVATILPTSPYRPTYARRFLFGVGRILICCSRRLWYCGRVTRSDASSSLPFVCPRKGRSQSRSYCTTANSMRPITLQSIIR